MKANHKDAQQQATDNRTGMIVVMDKTITYKWRMDVTHPRGGERVEAGRDFSVKYYESRGLLAWLKSMIGG